MNSENRIVIELLKASLKNNGEKVYINNNEDLKKVIEVSKKQQLEALIYKYIDNHSFSEIEENILNQFKTDIFNVNLFEIIKAKKIKSILIDLKNLNIDYIILKGGVIRNYYPNPEFRIMKDFDILIHKEDLDKVHRYFLNNKFELKDNNHPVHFEFIRADGVSIEVHWKLINNNTFTLDTSKFESRIWDNATTLNYQGVKVRSLGKEDLLTHLCIHMAKHLRGGGFGLRQVYDVVTFVIHEYESIDWNEFTETIEICGVKEFTGTLFSLIGETFSLKIFNEININSNIRFKYDILLEEILEYDVFNEKRRIDLSKKAKNISQIKKMFFPSLEELKENYPWAKNNMLLPFIWIHRGVKFLCKKLKNRDMEQKRLIIRRKFLLNEFKL